MPRRQRVLIIASGGGHTGYGVALAQRLVEKGVDVEFIIPRGDRWTRSKVERYGRVAAETTKFMGPRTPLWKGLLKAPAAVLEASRSISSDYDVVVSTGSNHSIAAALAARLKGIPVISIESSVRFTAPSRAARILRRFARITALQWPEQKKLIPEGVVVGPLYEKPEHKPYDGGYILVTTGTYGYKKLFDALLRIDEEHVVLQTGRVDPRRYKEARPEWTVFDYDPDLGRWIAGARVVVTHLGKTAIDAALTYGKPVVIAPNPEWTLHGAGLRDAEKLAEKLNAVLLPPDKLTPDKLLEAIREAEKRKPPRHPDGAGRLAEIIVRKEYEA